MSSKDFVPFEERPKPKGHEASQQSQGHEQDMAHLRQDLGPYVTAQGRPIPSLPISKKGMQMQAAWKQKDAECSRDPDDTITFPTKQLRQIIAADSQTSSTPMFPVKPDVKVASTTLTPGILGQQPKGGQPPQIAMAKQGMPEPLGSQVKLEDPNKLAGQKKPSSPAQIKLAQNIQRQISVNQPLTGDALRVEVIRQTFGCSPAVAQQLLQSRRKTGQIDGFFAIETVATPSFLSSTPQHQYNINMSQSEYDWYFKYVNTPAELRTVDLVIKEQQQQNFRDFARGAEDQQGAIKTYKTLSGRGNYDRLLRKLNQGQRGQDAVPTDLDTRLALLSPTQQAIYNRKVQSLQKVYGDKPLADFLRQSVFDQVQFETRLDVMEIATLGRSLDDHRRQKLEALYASKSDTFKGKASESVSAGFESQWGVDPIFGKDVSGKVKRVMRDKYLIQSDRHALEIAYLGRPLSAPQRTAADGFYTKLSPEQQQAYSQKADAEFNLMWGSELPNAKVAGQMKWVLRAQQMEQDYPGQVAREEKKALSKTPGAAQDAVTQSKKPSDPVTAFGQDLQHNAITRLSSNKTRLTTEEAKYKDTSATNQNWSHLRSLAAQDDSLRVQMVNTTDTLWKFIQTQTKSKPAAFSVGLTVPADKGDIAARRQQILGYFSSSVKDPAAQAQLVTMLDRLDVLETTQSDLRIQYPALGAINVQQAAKMSGKAGENEILLQQISGEFNKTRTSADQLIGQIQKDPAAALQLDRIVADTLAQDGVDKKKRQAGEPKSKAVLNWLEGEQQKDTAIKAVGTLATGGLTLAAFFAPEFAEPLLGGAALTGVATGLYELPELTRQNLAAESAQFGGKKLTSLEREETRFNLAMGYTNIVMAGLDTQLGQAAIKGLTKIPSVVVAAAKLTAQQSKVFVAALGRWTGQLSEANVQKIAKAIQQGDREVVVAGAAGEVNIKLDELPNQALQMKGTSAEQLAQRQTLLQQHPVLSGYSDATNRLLKANPAAAERLLNLNPKVLKTVLADSKLLDSAIQQAEVVNNIVGKKWSQLSADQKSQLKKFYRDYTTEKGTPVLAQHQDVGLQLHVDKNGVIVEGLSKNVSDLRISTDQMRKILKDANIPIIKDHSIHHKLPIAAGENDPLIKGAIELDGYDINNAANLEQLPRNSAARSESLASKNLPEHGQDNYHPKWNRHAQEVLRKKLDSLRYEYDIPENISSEEAVKMIHKKKFRCS